MFKTFKASIETEVESPGRGLSKGAVFRFDPEHPSVEWVMYDIQHETFEFSKEDVIFSLRQKIQYKDYLHLNPFSGGLFADGVKYKLHRKHIKGKTKYVIEVDGDKATLKLNWFNKGLIEWVHGRKINWNLWQAIIGILLVILTAIGIIATASISPKKDNKMQPVIEKSATNTLPMDTANKKKPQPFINYDTPQKNTIAQTTEPSYKIQSPPESVKYNKLRPENDSDYKNGNKDTTSGEFELYTIYANSYHYKGAIKNGKANGYGIATFKDKFKQEGFFRDNLRDGTFSIFDSTDKKVFSAIYKNDSIRKVLGAPFSYLFIDTLVGYYDGDVSDNFAPNGNGTFYFDKGYFTGRFENGEIKGGKAKMPYSFLYKFDGIKKLANLRISSTSYEGDVYNLNPHGKGILDFYNGGYFEGFFERGYFHGEGILVLGGVTVKGIWKHGIFKK